MHTEKTAIIFEKLDYMWLFSFCLVSFFFSFLFLSETNEHGMTYIKVPKGLKDRFYYIYFLLCLVACGILVPWSGIKPVSPELGAQSLNHWTTREVFFFFDHASLHEYNFK